MLREVFFSVDSLEGGGVDKMFLKVGLAEAVKFGLPR